MLLLKSEDEQIQRYVYHSTAASDQELLSDMSAFWEKLFLHIRNVRSDGSWNRIIFDFYCHDGIVISYPHKRGESPDKRLPELVLNLDILNETQNKLHDANSDKEIDNIVTLAYIRIRSAIRQSYKIVPAIIQLKLALESTDFTAWTMKDGDVETLYKFEIFFD